MKTTSLDRQPISHIAVFVAAILLLSGIVHLVLLAVTGSSWEGAVSFRKPALFGISGGLTVWSIAWVITRLSPHKLDSFLIGGLSIGLLIEVGLITMQFWRGVASHFNHETPWDTAIEMIMLGLILLATLGIFYLTIRTFWPNDLEPAMKIAIQGGMWLLSLSCLLGIATSVLGEMSIAAGRSYEVWGRAGVLKFPHGVALHAIQLLPLLAWLCRVLGLSHRGGLMAAALGSQVIFLVYAVWQTCNGRDRFDFDVVGGCLFGLVLLLAMIPILAIAKELAARVIRFCS